MAIFVVVFELREPDRTQAGLIEKIKSYTHIQALETAWLIESARNAAQIRDDLEGALGPIDGLAVLKVGEQAGWQGLSMEAEDWLTSRLRPTGPIR